MSWVYKNEDILYVQYEKISKIYLLSGKKKGKYRIMSMVCYLLSNRDK